MKKKLFENTQTIANILKVLSNADRLAILCYIDKDEKSVSSIHEVTDISQSQVSQYLKQMKLQNILDSRKDGKNVLYKISDDKILELMKSLKKTFCN